MTTGLLILGAAGMFFAGVSFKEKRGYALGAYMVTGGYFLIAALGSAS